MDIHKIDMTNANHISPACIEAHLGHYTVKVMQIKEVTRILRCVICQQGFLDTNILSHQSVSQKDICDSTHRKDAPCGN